VIASSGGASGVRDLAALESAVAQPKMTVGGQEAYPTLIEKAAALCFSLCSNHPFVDGNKRVAHAAAEVTLMLNGFQIKCGVDEQERVMLGLAEGAVSREEFLSWLQAHVRAT
jgi:death-on-curing protein